MLRAACRRAATLAHRSINQAALSVIRKSAEPRRLLPIGSFARELLKYSKSYRANQIVKAHIEYLIDDTMSWPHFTAQLEGHVSLREGRQYMNMTTVLQPEYGIIIEKTRTYYDALGNNTDPYIHYLLMFNGEMICERFVKQDFAKDSTIIVGHSPYMRRLFESISNQL